MTEDPDLLLRVAMAGLLGASLGFERETRNQIAGLRAHAIVAMGATLFTLAGAYGFADFAKSSNVDPLRVAAQVASGIGFIGAGAIMRNGATVRGVTTAATLWLAAAIGVAVGAGLYITATLGAALILAALIGFRAVEPVVARRLGTPTHLLTIEYERGHGTLGPVMRELERFDARPAEVRLEDDEDDCARPGARRVEIVVATRDVDRLRDVAAAMRLRPEVGNAHVR